MYFNICAVLFLSYVRYDQSGLSLIDGKYLLQGQLFQFGTRQTLSWLQMPDMKSSSFFFFLHVQHLDDLRYLVSATCSFVAVKNKYMYM